MVRFLKASSYYPSAIHWLYDRQPQLTTKPYAVQHAALMGAAIAWSNSWQRHLEGTDRFTACELVVNAEPLQKQWARENGVRFTEANWAADIFFAQCEHYQPDILFAHSHEVLLDWWRDQRARALDRLFVIGYDGTAKHLPEFAERCDLLLTCLKRSASFYEQQGLRCLYFPYGFESEVLARLTPANYAGTDLSFIGSVAVRAGHNRRTLQLAELSQRLPLRCWLSQLPASRMGVARLLAAMIRSREWEQVRCFPQTATSLRLLRRCNEGELYGLEMLSALAASRVTLNIHIDQAGVQAANIRLFEATGAGACLLTDWKENVADIFEPDREIVTFKSVDEAVEKADFLLSHESVRADIARRGQTRTLRDHSSGARVRAAAEYLLKQA